MGGVLSLLKVRDIDKATTQGQVILGHHLRSGSFQGHVIWVKDTQSSKILQY